MPQTPIATITAAPNFVDHQDGTTPVNPNEALSNPDLCAWLLGSLQQDGISGELGDAVWEGNIGIDSSRGRNVCAIQPVVEHLGHPANQAGEITLHLNDKSQPTPDGANISTADIEGHSATIWFTSTIGNTGQLITADGGNNFWLTLHLDPNDRSISSLPFISTQQFLTEVMGSLLDRWDRGKKPVV